MKNQLAEKNSRWKGEDVGYHALHSFVRARIQKPEFCVECKKVPPRDLANKSGNYKRDLSDWEYLCRSCHMEKDGRKKSLAQKAKENKLPAKICIGCGSMFHRLDQKRAKYCNRACAYKNFYKSLSKYKSGEYHN